MNREAIFTALWAQLNTLTDFKTRSRRVRHWEEVSAESQPAMFMAGEDEDVATESGMPSVHRMRATLYIYVRVDDNEPGPIINPLLDQITNLLNARDPRTGRNQLQLSNVAYCRVDGTIVMDEGTLDGQAVAQVPVVIYTTN